MLGHLRLPLVLFWLSVASIVAFMVIAIWLGVPDETASSTPLPVPPGA